MIFRLLIAFSKFLNFMPRSFRIALGSAVGWVWFHVVRFRREIVLENLRIAFGSEKSEAEIRALAARNFRHYGLTLVEIAQSVTWSKADYEREVPADGIEHLRQAIAKGHGVFGLNSHLGNWEWVIGSVMSRGIPGDVVVKRSKNPGLDRFLLNYRQNMGIGIFYESGTARDILRSLSRGRLVGFILDQFMGAPIGLPVTFFGKEAGTAIGLALLTEKKEAPIVPMYSYRDENDRLRAVIEPELTLPAFSENREDRLYEKTQFYNDVLERLVRKHPDQWLWLHRRWKTYRDEPRWKRSTVTAPALATLLLALVMGCASTSPTDTPTGIALPPDPVVSVPDEKAIESVEIVEDVKVETPVPAVEPKKEDSKEKKKPAPPPPAKKRPAAFNQRSFTPEQLPFEMGERMTIALNWTAIPAGEVKLEVKEGFPFHGRPTYRISGSVLSSKVVDTIYHIENSIETYVDRQWLLPYKFLLHMVETAQLKETRAAFDHKLNKVHYWSKRISKKWGDQVQDRVDNSYPLARDMFSALYYARTMDYEMGKPREIPVYENAQNLMVTLVPVANELVHTKAGAFQCWKLSLTVKIENVLKPSGDLFLWLSDDSKKYIVKFDSKLKIGSLKGELIQLRERL